MILILILCGCTMPPTKVPEEFQFKTIPFTKYTEKGFLFTPNNYEKDYESIGIIDATLYPEANLRSIKTGSPIGYISWKKKDINFEKALDSLYESCVEMGADALIQMKFDIVSKTKFKTTSKPLKIVGINIKGYAIKRN